MKATKTPPTLRGRGSRIAPWIVPLALAACRGAPAEEPGAWAAGQEWRLVEETRVGSALAEGADAFGRIADVEVDGGGRLWVADAQAKEVRVFDAAGRHVRTVGRPGAGPEEFGDLAGMSWSGDGRLWVLDSGNERWAMVDTSGRIVDTSPRRTGVSMAPWPGGFDREGRLHDVALLPPSSAHSGVGLVRYDRALQPLDTFPIPAYLGETMELTTRQGKGSTTQRTNVPFSPYQVWAVDGSGRVWIGTTDRYRLHQLELSGDTVRTVERRAVPVRVSKAELERVVENYAWFEREGGKVDRSRIPRVKPAFTSLFFDDRDHLWVIPSQPDGEPSAMDVFDPQGRYLGRVTAPVRILPAPAPVVRGGKMYAVTQDEDGVQSVVVLRVEQPGPGATAPR